jgi:uncharacterized membrane protein YdbT with pleckstrin-like domain
METSIPPREEVLFTLQPAWRSYFVFYVAILIFGFGPSLNPQAGLDQTSGLVLSILLILFVIFRRKTTFYRITKEGAIRETGFFSRMTKKMLPLEEISGLEIRRGIVHRLIGIGHLQFQSNNPAQPDLWWFGIADPFTIKDQVRRYLK